MWLTSGSLAHYQRSSDCKFFALSAPATKQRSGRPKKSRASKAARTSTQSTLTSVSDGGSITEAEINEDSILAMPAIEHEHSTKSTRGKKGGKPRRAPAKSKAKDLNPSLDEPAQVSSYIEPEDDDFEEKVEKRPGQKKNALKRKSDELNEDNTHGSNRTTPDHDPRPPPVKRRMTRASSSILPPEKTSHKILNNQHAYDMEVDYVENATLAAIPSTKKGSQNVVKRGKNGTSSVVPKEAPATSTVPMASSRDNIPTDDALDAALEADLDRPLTDNEDETEQSNIQYPKMRRLTRTRSKSRDAPAFLAPVRRTTRLGSLALQTPSLGEQDSLVQDTSRHVMGLDHTPQDESHKNVVATRSASRLFEERVLQNSIPMQDAHPVDLPSDVSAAHANDGTAQLKPIPQKSKKPMKGRQPSRHLSKRNAQPSIPTPTADLPSSNQNLVTSVFVPLVCEDEPGNASDVSVIKKGPMKRGEKKGKQGKDAVMMRRKSEKVMQGEVEDAVHHPEPVFVANTMHLVENATPTVLSHDIQIASASEEEFIGLVKPSESTQRSANSFGPRESVKSAKGRNSQTPAKAPIAIQPVEQILATPHVSGSERESTRLQASPIVENQARVPSVQTTPRPAASPQSSDAENQPPSSRPSSIRPPLLISPAQKLQTTRIPLTATPSNSPSKRNISRLQSSIPWSAIDYDKIFLGSPADKDNPFLSKPATNGEIVGLTSPEKKLSLEEWIQFNAQRGEDHLRSECERVIGKFEGEGVRALKTLEGITCVD